MLQDDVVQKTRWVGRKIGLLAKEFDYDLALREYEQTEETSEESYAEDADDDEESRMMQSRNEPESSDIRSSCADICPDETNEDDGSEPASHVKCWVFIKIWMFSSR